MNLSPLYCFLSENNVKNHLAYMRTLRLKYSILEKSLPRIKGVSPEELVRMNIPKKQSAELLPLILKIKAHELYFSSFTKTPKPCQLLKKYYISENSFCYELKEAAKRLDHGYLYVYKDGRGRPCFRTVEALDIGFLRDAPLLVIDLFEHSYFADYGFEYEKYLTGAISHLDFSRLCDRNSP